MDDNPGPGSLTNLWYILSGLDKEVQGKSYGIWEENDKSIKYTKQGETRLKNLVLFGLNTLCIGMVGVLREDRVCGQLVSSALGLCVVTDNVVILCRET